MQKGACAEDTQLELQATGFWLTCRVMNIRSKVCSVAQGSGTPHQWGKWVCCGQINRRRCTACTPCVRLTLTCVAVGESAAVGTLWQIWEGQQALLTAHHGLHSSQSSMGSATGQASSNFHFLACNLLHVGSVSANPPLGHSDLPEETHMLLIHLGLQRHPCRQCFDLRLP